MGRTLALGFTLDSLVMMVNCGHQPDQPGDSQYSEPCAFGKLRHNHYACSASGSQCAHAIDQHAAECATASRSSPMHDHAGLRKRECHKCADREQWDQTIGHYFEG